MSQLQSSDQEAETPKDVFFSSSSSAYCSRFCRFMRLTNPKHLLTKASEIRECQEWMNNRMDNNNRGFNGSGSGSGSSITITENDAIKTAKCKSMLEACVHPTTNQIVPAVGRMASFTPANIPISAGMLLAKPVLPNLIFWQWINQTYNAVFNSCNAAKSGGTGDKSAPDGSASAPATFLSKEETDLLKGYLGAVVVSVGLAVGLNRWLAKAKLSASTRKALHTVVPYTAVASAGMSNVGLMRLSELSTGLPVRTPDNEYLGHSREAAKKALIETMVTRALLPAPILLVPPVLINFALRWRVINSNRVLKFITQISCLAFGCVVGLPLAIAVFPQESQLAVEQLEDDLKNKIEQQKQKQQAQQQQKQKQQEQQQQKQKVNNDGRVILEDDLNKWLYVSFNKGL